MARPIRIEFPGAVYHILARGNQGQQIGHDDRERKLWLATVGEACHRTGWHNHAWADSMSSAKCGVRNYYWRWETPEANLVNGRQWLPALAWWLGERTTVSYRWVAERLPMGHESRVGQALATVAQATSGPLRTLKTKLTRGQR